jgi:hypothetical protein
MGYEARARSHPEGKVNTRSRPGARAGQAAERPQAVSGLRGVDAVACRTRGAAQSSRERSVIYDRESWRKGEKEQRQGCGRKISGGACKEEREDHARCCILSISVHRVAIETVDTRRSLSFEKGREMGQSSPLVSDRGKSAVEDDTASTARWTARRVGGTWLRARGVRRRRRRGQLEAQRVEKHRPKRGVSTLSSLLKKKPVSLTKKADTLSSLPPQADDVVRPRPKIRVPPRPGYHVAHHRHDEAHVLRQVLSPPVRRARCVSRPGA